MRTPVFVMRMRAYLRGRYFRLLPVFLTLLCFIPTNVSAADNKHLVFAYQTAKVSQSVGINTASKSSLTFTVSAAETQDWKTSSDELNIGIELRGVGGGLIYQHSTGTVNIDSSQFNDYSITVTKIGVGNDGWDAAITATAFIIGSDGEFWAGNYGTRIESASLKFDDDIELLQNTEFINQLNWSSDIGWQSCSGGSGNKPCISVTYPINNSSYSLNSQMVWATANEGSNLSISAPGGGTFSRVVFASYGTPSGDDGLFAQGGCHATNSIQKVSESLLGLSSGSIASNNAVFGDPCGGTYKKLSVVLEYTGGSPNTTTTTTTTIPSCGPYGELSVTGKTSGAVWGSGPYTDDSDMGVAAVHAGLITVGQTASIEPYDVLYYQSFPGSTQNGITTTDWLSGWCGYQIRLVVPPTTTTTEPETTTTQPQTTTTEEQTTTTRPAPATTTTEAPQEETTTSTEPQTTTTQQETTTTSTSSTTTIQEITTSSSVVPQTTALVPKTTSTTLKDTSTTSTTQEINTTTTSSSIVVATTVIPVTTTTIQESVIDQIIKENATKEEVRAAVEELISNGVSSEVAVEIVTNPEVIQNLSTDQAQEVFASVVVDELSDEEAQQFIAAVQDAPQEIRQTFENEINVFGGKFDTYVPVGSKVDVGTRRVVVAAGAAMFSAAAMGAGSPPPPPSQTPSGAQPSGSPSDSGEGSKSEKRRFRKGK